MGTVDDGHPDDELDRDDAGDTLAWASSRWLAVALDVVRSLPVDQARTLIRDELNGLRLSIDAALHDT